MTHPSFAVEAGHIRQFAQAIGDDNPIYADPVVAAASAVGGILAPPTFVKASAHVDPSWPFRTRPGEPWMGSGRTPTGLEPAADGDGSGDRPKFARMLHAEQRFEYHRPLLAGEVLTFAARAGATWEKDGRRGGALHFRETVTEFRDDAGDLVVTATWVGVTTGRTVEDG